MLWSISFLTYKSSSIHFRCCFLGILSQLSAVDVISVCSLAQVAWGEERGGIHAEGRVTHAKGGRREAQDITEATQVMLPILETRRLLSAEGKWKLDIK